MGIKKITKLLLLIPMFSVHAQNGFMVDLNLKTEPIDNGSIKQTGIGFSYFKDIGTNNKLFNTFNYKNTTVTNEIEEYVLKNYTTNYSSTSFNSFENIFEFSHQLTEKTKLNIELRPTANYESNFNLSDLSLLGGVEVSHSLNKNNSIALGVKRMAIFGKPQILPTFSYNHQFSEKTNLKLGFPNAELSYSNFNRNKFSLNNDFSGNRYNLYSPIIIEDSTEITKIGFSQMETTLQFERNLDTYWFLKFKAGYSSNKEFKFSDENLTTEINKNLKDGGVFSVNLKYKF